MRGCSPPTSSGLRRGGLRFHYVVAKAGDERKVALRLAGLAQDVRLVGFAYILERPAVSDPDTRVGGVERRG